MELRCIRLGIGERMRPTDLQSHDIMFGMLEIWMLYRAAVVRARMCSGSTPLNQMLWILQNVVLCLILKFDVLLTHCIKWLKRLIHSVFPYMAVKYVMSLSS